MYRQELTFPVGIVNTTGDCLCDKDKKELEMSYFVVQEKNGSFPIVRWEISHDIIFF